MAWEDLAPFGAVRVEADSESPDTAQFSYEGSRATLNLEFTPSLGLTGRLSLIVPRILGGSFTGASLPTKLSRILPCQHPIFPTLLAPEISAIQCRGPRGAVFEYDRQAGAPVSIQAYQKYRFVVVFTAVRYAVKRDDPTQTSELYRFVERYVQLGIENIIRPG